MPDDRRRDRYGVAAPSVRKRRAYDDCATRPARRRDRSVVSLSDSLSRSPATPVVTGNFENKRFHALKKNFVSATIDGSPPGGGRKDFMTNEPTTASRNGASGISHSERPYYRPMSNEEAVFKAAFRQGLSV